MVKLCTTVQYYVCHIFSTRNFTINYDWRTETHTYDEQLTTKIRTRDVLTRLFTTVYSRTLHRSALIPTAKFVAAIFSARNLLIDDDASSTEENKTERRN